MMKKFWTKKARYIRVEVTGISTGGKELSIAELSLF